MNNPNDPNAPALAAGISVGTAQMQGGDPTISGAPLPANSQQGGMTPPVGGSFTGGPTMAGGPGAFASTLSGGAGQGQGHAPPSSKGMNFVMDVPVELTIELGRRDMKISDVLKLGPGSTLELDKVSGDPLDIYVNNQLIARGEAVVIGERYGVRLTEVMVHEEEGL